MLTSVRHYNRLARPSTVLHRPAEADPEGIGPRSAAALACVSPDASVLGSIDALAIVAAQLRERAALSTEGRRAELLALAADYDQLVRIAAAGRKLPPLS
jgi:hypothetical protein